MVFWSEKKGEGAGDMVMVIWLFLLLTLVAGGIALGTRVFFGSGYDIRAVEAQALSERIEVCITDQGVDWETMQFYQLCRLSASVFEDFAENRLGILVCEDNCLTGKRLFQLGNNFEACDFTAKNEQYARCSRSIARHKDIQYEIIASSNQEARRVILK